MPLPAGRKAIDYKSYSGPSPRFRKRVWSHLHLRVCTIPHPLGVVLSLAQDFIRDFIQEDFMLVSSWAVQDFTCCRPLAKNRLSRSQLQPLALHPTNQLTSAYTLLTPSPLLMASCKALKSPALVALCTSIFSGFVWTGVIGVSDSPKYHGTRGPQRPGIS